MKTYIPYEETRRQYIKGISRFIQTPGFSSCYTFPEKRSIKLVKKSVSKVVRLINTQCYGRRYREKNQHLRCVCIIEGYKTHPHIHLITESNPNLSIESYKRIWLKVSPRTSSKAIKVVPIYNIYGLGRYCLKEVRWGDVDTEPILYGPKSDSHDKGGSYA